MELADKNLHGDDLHIKKDNLFNSHHHQQDLGSRECTASESTENWPMSSTTLMAFSAMRGPENVTDTDLYEWMQRCRRGEGRQKNFSQLQQKTSG